MTQIVTQAEIDRLIENEKNGGPTAVQELQNIYAAKIWNGVLRDATIHPPRREDGNTICSNCNFSTLEEGNALLYCPRCGVNFGRAIR